MATSPVAVLKAAYLLACQRYAVAEAKALSEGELVAFSVDGVSLDWPAYALYLLDNIDRAQERYLKAMTIEASEEPFEVASDLGG